MAPAVRAGTTRRGGGAPGVGAVASGRSVGGRPGLCGRTSLASARRDLSNPATHRADGPVDGGTNRLLLAPSAGAREARSVARPRSPRELGPRRRWCPAKKLWRKISLGRGSHLRQRSNLPDGSDSPTCCRPSFTGCAYGFQAKARRFVSLTAQRFKGQTVAPYRMKRELPSTKAKSEPPELIALCATE